MLSRLSAHFPSVGLCKSHRRLLHASANVNHAKRVLVIVEHDHAKLASNTLKAVKAATLLSPSDGVDVLVAGAACRAVCEQAQRLEGVHRVLVRDSPLYQHQLPEPLAKFLEGYLKKSAYSHILAASSNFSKNFLPRLGALLDVQPISEVMDIIGHDTFLRPIYAGNILATVQSQDAIKLFTIRPTSFQDCGTNQSGDGRPPIEELTDDYGAEGCNYSKWLSTETLSVGRADLTSAKVVVSGGRGLIGKEQFKLIYELADVFGNKAAVGASRAAVDSGFVPNDLQVGQTGKVVAPDLYFAIGISGAIQHLAGMKDSKIIVAINKDEEAPIFQVSDYALVGDLFNLVPKLISALKANAQSSPSA